MHGKKPKKKPQRESHRGEGSGEHGDPAQISGVYLGPFTNKPHSSEERIQSHYMVFTQEQHMFNQSVFNLNRLLQKHTKHIS